MQEEKCGCLRVNAEGIVPSLSKTQRVAKG